MFRWNRYLTKMIVFTIGVSTLPIIVLGLIFYYKASGTIQEKVNEGNIQILEQTRLRVEQVLAALDLQIERLADSSLVIDAMNEDIKPSQFQLVQNLQSSMYRVRTFDVSVQDIHLINLNKGWILNNRGFNRLSSLNTSKISHYVNMERNKFWSSDTEGILQPRSRPDARVISFVKKIPMFSDNPQGMFIVEIPSKELRNYLSKSNTLGEVLILDESYRLLASQNDNMRLEPGQLDTLISRLRGSEQNSGLYESQIGDDRVGIAFERSTFNNWIYLSVIPIDLIYFESRQTGWIILATCVLMLITAVLISLAGSRRMYAPIQYLYRSFFANQEKGRERIDELHIINEGFTSMFKDQVKMADKMNHHMKQLEEYYVLKLVLGEMKPSEIEEKLKLLEFDTSKWRRMVALTIQIDTLKGTRYSERDSELLLFAINNIVGDLISKQHRLKPLVVHSSQVTLMFEDPHSTEDFRAFIYTNAKRIQEEVDKYLSLRISIGISRPYDGVSHAYPAYKESLDALKYRMLFGQKLILHIDDVQPMQATVIQYPKELERQLLDAVKMADAGKIEPLLDSLFEEISSQNQSYCDYQIAVTRFFVNLIRILQESGLSHIELLGNDPPLLEQLYGLTTVEEVSAWFKHRMIEPMVHVYEQQRKTKYQNISQEVLQLIHNYFDTDISLESCSNVLNYHPSYISRVLKQELGISFSEYLIQYRLNKAKEMLEGTDMKIAEIAGKLRYNNSQNFIRSFRKFVGMTPGAYRSESNGMKHGTNDGATRGGVY